MPRGRVWPTPDNDDAYLGDEGDAIRRLKQAFCYGAPNTRYAFEAKYVTQLVVAARAMDRQPGYGIPQLEEVVKAEWV